MASNVYSDNVDELVKITNTHLTLRGRSKEKRKRDESASGACLEERLQNDKKMRRLIDHSIDCIKVAEFLNDFIFHPDDDDLELEDHIPHTEKSYINCLLQKKKDITERALELTKENKQLEEALFVKKMQLKDKMEERNASWNKAVKLYNSFSPRLNVSAETSEYSNSSSSVSEGNSAKSIYQKKLIEEIGKKYNFIQQISYVLHRLIIFSGVRWANQKNLLDIVLCTGKIINTTFNEFNLRKFNKFVVDCILKLDQPKWEHM